MKASSGPISRENRAQKLGSGCAVGIYSISCLLGSDCSSTLTPHQLSFFLTSPTFICCPFLSSNFKAAHFNISIVSVAPRVQQLRGGHWNVIFQKQHGSVLAPVVFSVNPFSRKISGFLPHKCPSGAPPSQMPGDMGCTSGARGTWPPRQGPSCAPLDPLWLLCHSEGLFPCLGPSPKIPVQRQLCCLK